MKMGFDKYTEIKALLSCIDERSHIRDEVNGRVSDGKISIPDDDIKKLKCALNSIKKMVTCAVEILDNEL